MRVRRLDRNHDWVFGNGLNDYSRHSGAIAQCIKTALLSLRTDWFLDNSQGIRWFDYLRKTPDIVAMENEIKEAVLSIDGVVEIIDFDISLDENTRGCTVSVIYNDIYQENRVSVNVTSNE